MSTDAPPRDIALVQRDRDEARSSMSRGWVLLCLVPVLMVIALALGALFDSFAPVYVALMYMLLGGAFGVYSLGAGALQYRLASKELKQIEAERIPQARLLT